MPRTPVEFTGNVHLVQHGTNAHIAGRRVYFGTVAGYAMEDRQYTATVEREAAQRGLDVEQYIARKVAHALMRHAAHNTKAVANRQPWNMHATHWCNVHSTCLHNNPAKYEADRAAELQWPHMQFGDRVVLEGVVYSLQPAPNDNVDLLPVQPDPDTFYL